MVLVTGANGYLGQGIVKQLLDDGMEVVAVSRHTEHIDRRAKIISCNIFDIENPYEFFGYPDTLLHLAWRDGFSHYSSSHIDDLPLHYTFLCKMAAGKRIKKIAILGTMHEVGRWEGSIDENTPCNPLTPYGISKNALRLLAEQICKKSNICFQWLRGYYIVGNSPFGSSVFSKIAAADRRGEKHFPFSHGQNQCDFIDYDVFCRYVSKVIAQDKVNGIINISSGHSEKLSDRVERFIQENGFKISLDYGAFPDRPYDSPVIRGSDRKIKMILNEG